MSEFKTNFPQAERHGKAMSSLQINSQSCRICINKSEKVISLNEIINGRTLVEMLRYCVKLEIFENDDLPFQCCADCKSDLVVAYNLVIRCKESDALYRSQLKNSKDVTKLTSFESNNMTTDIQFKTEIKGEHECIYAEPISDLFALSDESGSNRMKRDHSRSSSEDDDCDDDDKIGDDIQEKNAVDEIICELKRRKCVKKESLFSPKRCCKCKMRLENIEQVEQHSKTHIESKVTDKQKITARPFECSVCFKRYTKKRALLLHQREMFIEKQFQCDECDEDFHTEPQLADHKESHAKVENCYSGRKGQLPKCCACYQQFESEELLKKHADEIHLPESQTSTSDNAYRFTCNICHRRYKTKRVLMEHKSKPYRVKQYQCDQCGTIFRDKCAFSDHERSHLGENHPYVCPVCSKTFASKHSYRKHVVLHSIEDDRFKCEVCGKGFKMKASLKQHSITHAPDDRPLSCSLCSATFARKTCLKTHMRVHTGDRPYKCDICDASYPFPSDLKRHIMAHKGIKPHICNVCGRGYPRPDYLRKHLASHTVNN
ncbi:oocyte zinc finger protein XlCOF6-like [Toxorhynchites rutilus septentrionalis]|uniref:oocyte zinc finger protein XlCOF6-like n=1 Tax=Toxorhynchites rutilus septentrionalis TaxID=329112 RepID=UPI00247AC2A2|nr:oocyte zinc finger protein XlCOF6-like [Toxorhynchites rutilus septentrionalis]